MKEQKQWHSIAISTIEKELEPKNEEIRHKNEQIKRKDQEIQELRGKFCMALRTIKSKDVEIKKKEKEFKEKVKEIKENYEESKKKDKQIMDLEIDKNWWKGHEYAKRWQKADLEVMGQKLDKLQESLATNQILDAINGTKGKIDNLGSDLATKFNHVQDNMIKQHDLAGLGHQSSTQHTQITQLLSQFNLNNETLSQKQEALARRVEGSLEQEATRIESLVKKVQTVAIGL